MKKTLYTILLAAGMTTLWSCESDIDNFMVDDTVGFLSPGLVTAEVYTGLDDPYDVYVLKSGKGFQSAEVSATVDESILTEYNEANQDNVLALPSDCYKLTKSAMSMSNGDYKMAFTITWDRSRLATVLDANPNQGIPLRLNVGETGVNVDEERLTTIIVPMLTEPYISLETYGRVTGLMPTRRTAMEEDIYMTVMSNFIAKNDIEYSISVDPTLVDKYNAENGTAFQVLPAEAYDLKNDGWLIKKYMNSSMFKFTFKREALIPVDGSSKFGEYLLPLRISKVSSSQIDAEKAYVLYSVSVVATKLDKTNMSVIECNSVIADDPEPAWAEQNYSPDYLLDGTTSTEWRSVWSVNPQMPYIFVIDLGADRDISKVGFENPVGKNNRYANSKSGHVEMSADGNTWTNVGTWEIAEQTAPVMEAEVKPFRGRYLKFCVDEVWNTKTTHNAIAELNFWGE